MHSESGAPPAAGIARAVWSCAVPMIAALVPFAVAPAASQPRIVGRLADGRAVHRYDIANRLGTSVGLSDLGAGLVSIETPDRAGRRADILIHPGDPAQMIASTKRYGRTVGRYAGRLSGGFSIGGRFYPLKTNASGVTLHGGDPGLDAQIWQARPFATGRAIGVEFTLTSPDGAQGFPGTLRLKVRYELARAANILTIRDAARSDRATVINLTNHAYFNLAGGGTIGCHTLAIDAGRYVETDARRLPTGRLPTVAGTPLDFRKPVRLAAPIAADDALIRTIGGLDHMLLFTPHGRATLAEPMSGRTLTLTSDQPGVQIYTANGFDGSERTASGQPIRDHDAIALEPGRLPDSPNRPAFPSATLRPGHPYHAVTALAFGTMPTPRPARACTA